jgi:hypothetical protein
MTNILIYATVVLGIIAYYQITVDLGRSNFLVELAGIIGTPALIVFLLLQIRRRWAELVAH